jgi:hypothetical protein
VQVENRIRGKPRRLIGFIADKKLVADEQCIASNLELIGDPVIDTGLDQIAGYRWNAIARQYLDGVVAIPERTGGINPQRVEEARVHQGIAGI